MKKSLYLAADVARRWDPEFAAYYARRYARGDHHDYIVVALARKMALRVYALLKRCEASRQSQKSTEIEYILRTPEGREIEAKEARKLIEEKYAREVVAPARAQREAAKKKPTQSKKRWPPKDATRGVVPAPTNIATPTTEDNSHSIFPPIPLADLLIENLKHITSESLQKALENLLTKGEQND